METINERLTALPDILGYDSPAALAKASGLDPNTLRKAMQGPSNPSFVVLNALLGKHKKLSANWLIRGEGVALPESSAAAGQLPPAIPSRHEAAEPGQPYWRIVADNEELKQVKDERDYLREQNRRLLDLLANTSSFNRPSAGGAKETASADTANLYALTDRLCVWGLVRYPEAEETEEEHEAAHFSIDGRRLAA